MREYRRILHALQPVSPGWTTTATTVSSINQIGYEEIWKTIKDVKKLIKENDYWEARREEQTSDWYREMNNDCLIVSFFSEPGKKEEVNKLEQALLEGNLIVASAVDKLFK